MGRTGMAGRGLLGRWGPNHAADPVVTRLVILSIKALQNIRRFNIGSIARDFGSVLDN